MRAVCRSNGGRKQRRLFIRLHVYDRMDHLGFIFGVGSEIDYGIGARSRIVFGCIVVSIAIIDRPECLEMDFVDLCLWGDSVMMITSVETDHEKTSLV